MRRPIGVALFLVLTTRAAFAASPRIVVLEGLDLPGHMTDYHSQARQTIERAARESGREVVTVDGPRWCTTADCFRSLAREGGAGEMVTIQGGRNETEGYRIDLELRHADGDVAARQTGSCDACNGPDMVSLADKLGRALMASAPPPAVAASASVLSATAPVPSTGLDMRQSTAPGMWIGVAVGSAGLAAAVTGGYLWHLDGRATGCQANAVGGSACPNEYATARLGISLLAAGAAAAVVGAVIVFRSRGAEHTGVAVGPGSLALVGRF